RLLPRIAAGEALVALAVDDNNHHDPLYTNTKARRTEGGYALDGSKVFVAEGNYADFLIVVARDESEHFVLLLVDAGAAGVSKKSVQL
ncbi:MAG: acyl-CoA dehydrogenase, partial [Burkholderiales bacterium]|nr:acyl-CoA dehydrogenase [Burkholderiales bacterium]